MLPDNDSFSCFQNILSQLLDRIRFAGSKKAPLRFSVKTGVGPPSSRRDVNEDPLNPPPSPQKQAVL